MTTRTEKRQSLFDQVAAQAAHFTATQARALEYSIRSLAHHA